MKTGKCCAGLLLLLLAIGGCQRSPEAKRDRHLATGKKYYQAKDYARAVLEFKSAVQAMPSDAESYYQLGLASTATGDLRTALAAFRQATALNPKHSQAQLSLAQLMASASDQQWVKQAEDRLKTLMEESAATPEMLTTWAITELKLGKVDDAAEALEQALDAAPKELNASILLALTKLYQKDTNGAEQVLKKAAEAMPTSAQPLVMLARFYQSQRRTAEAEGVLQRALALDRNNSAALMDLARVQAFLGRKPEAEANFKRLANSGDPQYKPVYAQFLWNEGRRDKAVREFERLSKEDPDDRQARTHLVAAYQAVNRISDAERVLTEALKRNPKDLDALLQQGELFLRANQYSKAEGNLNKVLQLKPDFAAVHYALARLHQARGSALLARQELFATLQLDPFLLGARLDLARSLLAAKIPKAALDVLDSAPQSQKDLPAVVMQRNWVLWAMGDLPQMRKGIDAVSSRTTRTDLLLQDGLWKLRAGNAAGARKVLEEALKTNPSDVRVLIALKDAYVAQKQTAAAVQKVKQHAAEQRQSAPIQELLGLVLISNGERQEARAAFQAAKAADPKYVAADFALIQTDLVDGKFDDAQRRLEKIVAGDSATQLARLWLGNLQAMRGDGKNAVEQFRQVVAADPGNAQALNNLAYLLAQQGGQLSEALKHAQKAQELAPENAEYRDTLGWVLYSQGLYPLAVKELERATAKGRDPRWQYHLAMAYAKSGDLNRARTALEAARKQNPHLPEAKSAQEVLDAATTTK